MAWIIIALLVVIALILGWIAFVITDLSGQIDELKAQDRQGKIQILNNLIEIEGHTGRAAKPFYDADSHRLLNPDLYPD